MTPLELAQEYMDIVFKMDDLERLRKILSDDLEFNGPLYQFNSADAYISSMQANPPRDFSYEMIKTYEDHTSACLVYQFSKPGISVPMVQTFEIQNDKIRYMLLVFDTQAFDSESGGQ